MIVVRSFLSFFLVLFSVTVASGQLISPYVPGHNWSGITRYSINDGLPSRNTTATIKDRRGFIWVGTQNGLCRFDGYKFKLFLSEVNNTNTITNNYINAICEDLNGKIWVATMDGLNLFDPLSETFQRFYQDNHKQNTLSNNKVWSILCDRKGTVWIGTDDGFNQYLPESKNFLVYKPNKNRPGSMVGKSVNSIIEDKNNDLWLGNWSGGLNKFDKSKKTFKNFQQYHRPGEKNPNDIWSLCYAPDGSIWVGSYWDGLFNFDPKNGKFSKIEHPGKKEYAVFSTMIADENLILIGEDDGFYFYDTKAKKWQNVNNVKNYANGDSYKDNEGTIWINARNGLYKLDDKKYKFTLNKLSFKGREISTMVIRNAVLWLGTNNGLIKIDQRTEKVSVFTKNNDSNSLTNNNISKLYFDNEGRLWVLTENGFDCYYEKENRFEHHYHHSAIGNLFNEDVFRDILEVENGIYYLATDAGIKVYDSRKKQFKHYYNQPNNPLSINNNHTYNLCKAPDGKIWIGTYGGGINIFDRVTGRFQSIKTQDANGKGLSSNVINAIYTDSKKNIWICTPDGLNKYMPSHNRFLIFAKKDGFSSNIFKDITEDIWGTIWLITENGISSINPITNEVRNFDESDGVLVSAVIANDGHSIYVGGNNNFLSFNPQDIKLNKQISPVYIIDFQLFNKTVLPNAKGPLKENLNTAKEITLSHNQSVFSLGFVAPNYADPLKINYAYRLIGFEHKWNYVGNQQKATYTNLNPGTYRFQVKATNSDGVWNNNCASIIIRIYPPWYLTWWAYFFYISLLTLGVCGYISYKRKQEKLSYEVKIAHIESEKEKELNERKLSFFTNISHEFRTPLTLIINPVKDLLDQHLDTSSMNVVYRNAKRLLSLVDQLLLFRRADAQGDTFIASKLNIVDLVKEVFLCFANQARTKKINYNFHSSSNSIEVYADREKLEIATFNLISNAFKFTPNEGNISIAVYENADDVHVKIKDSGCGITDEAKERIFNRFYQEPDNNRSFGSGFGIGLYLAKNYIDMHGGEISFESDKDSGTLFTVKILKGDHHINQAIITSDIHESSSLLRELNQDDLYTEPVDGKKRVPDEDFSQEKKSILIIDDHAELANYLSEIFSEQYNILQAWDGEKGLVIIRELLPDVVISDVMMDGMGGVELCRIVKKDEAICHIPVVLLTASTSAELKLRGIESGADDFISKPFDKDLLIARVAGILKSKNSLQKYFFSEITLSPNSSKISSEYKDFLMNCINIVEHHIEDPDFNIKILADETGMSRANLFNKIKSISGHSPNSFIRFIRLRKAAEIFITTNNTIKETMYMVGLNDIKYFREQFKKVFEMNPSAYIKKYRNTFSKNASISRSLRKRRE